MTEAAYYLCVISFLYKLKTAEKDRLKARSYSRSLFFLLFVNFFLKKIAFISNQSYLCSSKIFSLRYFFSRLRISQTHFPKTNSHVVDLSN